MTNIKLKGNKEIDLLAIDPIKLERYHIEVRAWTDRRMKLRHEDLGYFQREKFEHPIVKQKIHELFGDSDYHKVLVVWNTEDNFKVLPKIAEKEYSIEIWRLKDMIHHFTKRKITSGSRDDVLRLMELIALEERESLQESYKLIEKALKESDIHGDRRKEFSKALRTVKRRISEPLSQSEKKNHED
jgi:hypothetical protein